MKPGTAPLLVRSPLHDALYAVSTKAVTATTGTVSGVWGEHKALVLSTAAALALLAPVLLRLPRKAGITAAVLVVALLQMAFDMSPDQVLLEASVVLCLTGVLGMKDVLEGFSSDGVVAVGVMCAVAKGVQCTGGLELLARVLLGRPKGHMWAMVRLLLPVLAISAFMNNTPVCAMFMPIVSSWASSLGIPATQMLMPLSFATMLGGTLSLIGSSTNIVAAGVANKQALLDVAKGGAPFSMGMFDILPVGLINAAAGCAYMVLAGRPLLPGGDYVAPAAGAGETRAAASAPPRGAARMWFALIALSATMAIASQQPKQLILVALACLCAFVRTGCMDLSDAWRAVNGPVLLSIALSFALGKALTVSGLADLVAAKIVTIVAPLGPLALLYVIYFVAICVGAVISNNAVVVLMFPIVVRVCEGAGTSWRAPFYALTMAASASFSTPMSYQTNLMVQGPGGYAFADFLRFGLPLQLVCMLAAVPACHMMFG